MEFDIMQKLKVQKANAERELWQVADSTPSSVAWSCLYGALVGALLIAFTYLIGVRMTKSVMVGMWVVITCASGFIGSIFIPAKRCTDIQFAVYRWLRDELRKSLTDLRARVSASPTEESVVLELRLRIAQHTVVKLIADDIQQDGLKAARISSDDEFKNEVDAIVETMVPFPLSELIKDLEF